jgi:hypothetical protein
MLGRIMPAPLLMPLMCTVLPPISTRAPNALGAVSVVMMPSAARNQLAGLASAMAAASPASMRSLGRGSIMTPVEKGSICSTATPRRLESAVQVLFARASPSAPVPALALPVLMSSARTPCPCWRLSRQICTGAAQKRLVVKTPPTLAPSSSNMTVRSLRAVFLMAASVTPMRTPAIGKRVCGSGWGRLTGIAGFQADWLA